MVVALALLAYCPLALFAYLGHFSRLTYDDYGYLAKPLESGTWEAMLFWREHWNSDYTNFFVYGLLAPLGERLPAVFPSVIIVVGLVGFTWFNTKLLTFLGVKRHLRLVAAALAALNLVAVIGGTFSLASFYWFTASVEYMLPVMILVVSLALGAKAVGWATTPRRRSTAAVAFAALAFLNAGFSEMYLVFQAVALALLGVCAYGIAGRSDRRLTIVLILAALMGTAVGAATHLSAAGIAYRLALTELWGRPIEPIRELPLLIVHTLETLPRYLTHQFAFSGFKMLAAAGLAVTLAFSRPARPAVGERWQPAARWPHLIGLLVQLGYLPFLWSHTSDLQQVLGRYSYSYCLVLALNLGLIVALLAMIVQPDRCNKYLNSPRGNLLYHSLALCIIGFLFALPEVRSILDEAILYFLVTAYLLAGIYIWQLAFAFAEKVDRQTGRVGLLSLSSAGITVALLASMVAVVSWVQGAIWEYSVAPVVAPLTLTGLLWGASVGVLIRRQLPAANGLRVWYMVAILASLLVAIANGWTLVSAQLQKADELAEHARIWDETHQEILTLLAEDRSAVSSREFLFRSFHINRLYPLQYAPRQLHWHQKLFYGLDYEPEFG